MLVETHAHLDFPQYDKDRGDVIDRAHKVGVGVIINVSSNIKGCFDSVRLSQEYDSIFATCGIHPHDARDVTDEVISKIRELITSSKKVVAIGEVGLDFYRDLSPRDKQYEVFVKFIRLAKELNLPLILHCREESPDKKDAARLLIDALKENHNPPYRAVMHCFSSDKDVLKESLALGLYISFTCNITFKNADRLRKLLSGVPLERLLLETDSPFLAPQVKRGSRNEPAYIIYLVEAVAEYIGISKDKVEEVTTENAKRLFRI